MVAGEFSGLLLGALLTLWTNNIKIKAIKLQADFNDRQSSISDRSAVVCRGRCRCRCLVADILRLPVVLVVVSVVAVVVVVAVLPSVDFRRKCFLNILYILCAFFNVLPPAVADDAGAQFSSFCW